MGERGGGTETERDERQEAQILQLCIVFLAFSPQRPYDSCLLLSTVGLGWSCQVLGVPGVHREKLGAVWLEVVPRPLEVGSHRRLYRETSSSA